MQSTTEKKRSQLLATHAMATSKPFQAPCEVDLGWAASTRLPGGGAQGAELPLRHSQRLPETRAVQSIVVGEDHETRPRSPAGFPAGTQDFSDISKSIAPCSVGPIHPWVLLSSELSGLAAFERIRKGLAQILTFCRSDITISYRKTRGTLESDMFGCSHVSDAATPKV